MVRRRRSNGLVVVAACAFLVAIAAAVASGSGPAAAIGPVAGPDTYTNPVHAADFPDPFVLRSGSTYHAYGTHRGLANIQILRSNDLVTWRELGTALPFLPDWAAGPYVWAPSVLARPGSYVLYYSVAERRTGLFCVSAAVSRHGPQGPFVDRSLQPLVCQRDRRGTIDPSPFVDEDGTAWLLFKSEGIEGREPTRIWSQRLRADGLALEGPTHHLLVTEQAWEEPIIENPAMVRAEGRYFLFYSANRWRSADYAVGYAVCDAPGGPCRRELDGPLFASANGAAGPGGVELFTDPDGRTWMAYHAWTADRVGYPEGARSLRIDRVTFAQGRPWVSAPTTDTMPFDHVPGPPPPPPEPPPSPSPPSPPPPDAPVPAGAAGPPAGPAGDGSDRQPPAATPGGPATGAGDVPPGAARRFTRALPEVHPPQRAGTHDAPRIERTAGAEDLAFDGTGTAGGATGLPVPALAAALLVLALAGGIGAGTSRRWS